MTVKYTQRLFAAELLVEVERGLVEADPPFSPTRLGEWAFHKRLIHEGRMNDGLADKMMTIELLAEGSEFAMSVEEIRAFAKAML